MITCSKCGNTCHDGDNFCCMCGNKLSATPDVTTPAPAPEKGDTYCHHCGGWVNVGDDGRCNDCGGRLYASE